MQLQGVLLPDFWKFTEFVIAPGSLFGAVGAARSGRYLDYRCKNPMDAGCPSGSTSSRRFPGGLIFLEAR